MVELLGLGISGTDGDAAWRLGVNRRRRRALATTLTELKLMAAAAESLGKQILPPKERPTEGPPETASA